MTPQQQIKANNDRIEELKGFITLGAQTQIEHLKTENKKLQAQLKSKG
jgi:TolA-binding protein